MKLHHLGYQVRKDVKAWLRGCIRLRLACSSPVHLDVYHISSVAVSKDFWRQVSMRSGSYSILTLVFGSAKGQQGGDQAHIEVRGACLGLITHCTLIRTTPPFGE